MLKLGRKVGERTRIECPDGELIWVTQCKTHCEVEHGNNRLIADYDGSAWIDFPNGDVIEVQYNPYNPAQRGLRIGIDAPLSYKIMREELLDEKDRYDNTQRIDT